MRRVSLCFALVIGLLSVGTHSAIPPEPPLRNPNAEAVAEQFRGCSGYPNPFPINKEAPTLIRSVPNGKRYLAGQGNDTFHVAHVYGSHYDMGFAQGQLFREFFPAWWNTFLNFFDNITYKDFPGWPHWLVDLINNEGLFLLLQNSRENTEAFTPQAYIDEMRGIAAGANFPSEYIYAVNMFPELVKAACTVVGATYPSTLNAKLAHLRALDFTPTMPFKDWPLVTIMHGDGTAPKVANFGWIGFVGSLTGISDHPIGIGEKVWLQPEYDGVVGQPWMFILRDVLYTRSLQQALTVMRTANRTCAIHVGVGDGVENDFRGVTMAQQAFDVYEWDTLNYTNHPALKGIMYWDKHKQPTHFQCLSSMLQGMYGQLSAEALAVNITGIGETGDMQLAAFDYENLGVYYSNARKTNITAGSLYAFQRQLTYLDLKSLFAVQPPSL